MITLVPMTEADFQPYIERLSAAYAQEQVASGDWTPDNALKLAAEAIRLSLPDGLATPDHHLYFIHDDAAGANVGQLWVRVKRGDEPSMFIMDIEIHEPFQRRGYAQAALAALEVQARALGIDKIGLHVHVQNHGAKALYEKMGFAVTGHSMLKRLGS